MKSESIIKQLKCLAILLLCGLLGACSTNYVTPAGGVNLSSISDVEIKELMLREPSAQFPVKIIVARLQSGDHLRYPYKGYGQNGFSLVLARDIEANNSFARIASWQGIDSVGTLNQMLLPESLTSLKDLRLAAARLKADLVYAYSIDSRFHVEGKPLGPLSLISLGFIPNKKAHITATTSGMLIDVRSGYIYGVTEASATENQRATVWNSESVIDGARLRAEKQSYAKFLDESEVMWTQLYQQYRF